MRRGILAPAAGAAILAVAAWPHEAAPHNPVTTTVTFNREIATLFQQKCLHCHIEGGLAMSLASWAEARPWAVAIKEEILARRMPPWPAERGYGTFANGVGLTAREFDFLLSWIDGGVPRGEGDDPVVVDHSAHWMLGDPDALGVAEAGATVEAGSPAVWNRLVIDPGTGDERWVRALDYKPGDRRVARAAFFTLESTGQYLGGWTPWHPTIELPDGLAFRLPAGERLIVELLDSGIGQTVVDRPSVGLYYAPAPTAAVTSLVLAPEGEPLEAAGARRAVGQLLLAAETTVLSLRPELGRFGRSVEVKARRPDGSVQMLLWIHDFRQDWQTPYLFRQPVTLPAGSRIHAAATFEPALDSVAAPGFRVIFTAVSSSSG